MRVVLILLCIVSFFVFGCKDENNPVSSPKAPVIADSPASPTLDSSSSDPSERWEKKELEKMGITQDMTPSEIMSQDNKMKMKDIINWDQ